MPPVYFPASGYMLSVSCVKIILSYEEYYSADNL